MALSHFCTGTDPLLFQVCSPLGQGIGFIQRDILMPFIALSLSLTNRSSYKKLNAKTLLSPNKFERKNSSMSCILSQC